MTSDDKQKLTISKIRLNPETINSSNDNQHCNWRADGGQQWRCPLTGRREGSERKQHSAGATVTLLDACLEWEPISVLGLLGAEEPRLNDQLA